MPSGECIWGRMEARPGTVPWFERGDCEQWVGRFVCMTQVIAFHVLGYWRQDGRLLIQLWAVVLLRPPLDLPSAPERIEPLNWWKFLLFRRFYFHMKLTLLSKTIETLSFLSLWLIINGQSIAQKSKAKYKQNGSFNWDPSESSQLSNNVWEYLRTEMKIKKS